ncbi:MAG: DUF4286 family protein [Candidatus Kapabacteria bacterium]|nr:DUF4286 family protein [Candidatus Kapabacteria bacterium]
MITYQVEVTVPTELVDAWVEYMTTQHIADVANTGLFLTAHLITVVDPITLDATVFRVRYACRSIEDLEQYRREYASVLQAHHTERFGDAITAVRSVTEDLWHLS